MRTKRKIINLYDKDVKDIFSIKHVISISTEEDLNQFWDYITSTQDSKHDTLHNFVSSFYNFALLYVSREDAHFFEIILEENEDNFYFTLWNEKVAVLFEAYLQNTSTEFIYEKNKISIKLLKKEYELKILKQEIADKSREEKLLNSVKEEPQIKCLEPYYFLTQDDLQELLSLNDDMQEISYQIHKGAISEHHFIKLRSSFSLFCFTLRYYDEITNVTTTLNNFLNLLNTDKDAFLLFDTDQFSLVYGFVGNIDRWLNTLFIQGGADIDFMNNSIQADYETISQIITPVACEENFDLDDIFDF
ncbi:hypothetical protein JHD49_04920 [Sulfurimonas sp. SAG-AH-194-C21]|nr:hypothetical protein [Sulfurimonas sp. SAG-AH-194-C21]MDF1883276.1 hypothetical protein [Sulfurimonas sp. SAG-AH-194-C21]